RPAAVQAPAALQAARSWWPLNPRVSACASTLGWALPALQAGRRPPASSSTAPHPPSHPPRARLSLWEDSTRAAWSLAASSLRKGNSMIGRISRPLSLALLATFLALPLVAQSVPGPRESAVLVQIWERLAAPVLSLFSFRRDRWPWCSGSPWPCVPVSGGHRERRPEHLGPERLAVSK